MAQRLLRSQSANTSICDVKMTRTRTLWRKTSRKPLPWYLQSMGTSRQSHGPNATSEQACLQDSVILNSWLTGSIEFASIPGQPPCKSEDFALMLVYKDLLNLCLSTFFVLFRILELGMSRHVQSHLSFQYRPTEFPTSTGNSLQLSIFFFSSS